MNTTPPGTMRQMGRCGLALGLTAICAGALAAEAGKTLEVKLGETIQRTWDDVQKADYAYGPKQEFDAATKETHVWLPYGSKGLYFETAGARLTDPGPEPGTACPLLQSADGNSSGRLVFKLHFDKPIGAFRFYAGWSEWGVGGDTAGGVEYSVDGRKWSAIREINETKAEARIIEPFVDGKKTFSGLSTQDLYIRCYSRDKNNPEAGFGPNRWMKFRMGGDPAWGDVATTFFSCQLQVWVTPAEGGAAGPVNPAVGEATAQELQAAVEEVRAAAKEARAAAEEARRAAQEAREAAQGAKPSQPSPKAVTPGAPQPVLSGASRAEPGASAKVDPPPSAAGGVTAVRASDFLNSISVCTHIGQGIDRASESATALAYAGIRNIRDDANAGRIPDWISVHKKAGVKVVLTWSGPDDAAIASLIDSSKQLAAAGALLALDGPNEPNNWAVTYQGQKSQANGTFLPVANWQRAFYSKVKSDPVLKDYPVFHSSEAGGSEPDNVGLQFLTIPNGAGTLMPDGTKYADYANVHNYICRQPKIIDNMAWLNAAPLFHDWTDGIYVEYGKTWRKGFSGYSNADLVTLPRVTTETGWATGGKDRLTQQQQGRLYLNMYLAQFKQGFKYTFMYMLRDAGGGDAGFGIVDASYRPKTSATYLHNLTTILADSGSIATPAKLRYSIPDQPATVHDLLLEKSDGKFELLIWSEKASGTNSVTVHLGGSCTSVRVYDPTTGTSPAQSLRKFASVPLTLSDHPVVIEIVD